MSRRGGGVGELEGGGVGITFILPVTSIHKAKLYHSTLKTVLLWTPGLYPGIQGPRMSSLILFFLYHIDGDSIPSYFIFYNKLFIE